MIKESGFLDGSKAISLGWKSELIEESGKSGNFKMVTFLKIHNPDCIGFNIRCIVAYI